LFIVLASLLVGIPTSVEVHAAEISAVLFKDVRIFDGVDATLNRGDVLVVGNKISKVAPGGGIAAPAGAELIEGRGRILSPGFIDIHAHVNIALPIDYLDDHPSVAGAAAGIAARSYLDQGFTAVRDAGGTPPDFARAIDAGLFPGPRIYPSGAVITQTSGHGDTRGKNDPHPTLCNCGMSHYLGHGFSVIADGVPQWLAAVREDLKHGATQIKIMGGGGVASDYDPIHSLQPSPEEIRAAVQAAGDWGTYVMAHAYTTEAVQRLVENGVKVIEHGLLIDEATAKLCADKGIVMSTQVAVFRMGADLPGMTDNNRAKMQQVLAGQDRLMGYVKKYGLKTGFGTDLVFGMYDRLGKEFTARADYFTPAEILRQATSESAEILRMAGKLDRYDRFGEIREGWLADLLLIEGDPFEDISILERPDDSLAMIMKDGVFHKR
jgi:imidazolonepropionase-like amidohydrolase